jgi:glycosyltransferase involved in cell wall biosynthesis
MKTMKILAVEENLLRPLGGGELSFRTLLRELSERHDIYSFGKRVSESVHADFSTSGFPVFEMPRTYMLSKYLVFKQVERQVERYIKQIDPDLILTQQDFAAPTLKAASHAGVPSVVFIRNYEHFCLCANPEQKCNRHCSECYGYGRWNPYRYCVDAVFAYERRWLGEASLVVSNSAYMRNVVKDWLDIDSTIVYPFVQPIQMLCHDQEYITFINPAKHKGVEIVLKLACLLPERKFLVVGSPPDASPLPKIDNIARTPWVNDISRVYSRTRVLLVPSIWPEPFGRVCAEAASLGIPCVASRIGGIPEVVGSGGILVEDIENVSEWVKGIETLDSNAAYTEYSRNARLHANNFSLEETMKSFKSQVEERLGLQL